MKFDSCASRKWKNCGCGTTGDDVNGGASSKLISGLMWFSGVPADAHGDACS